MALRNYGKSWFDFVKGLLERLYKLCLTYLYFFRTCFSAEIFFQNFGWSYVFNIFKSKPFFIKCDFSSYNMFYSYNIYEEKYVFPENKLSFVAAIISIIKSIIFVWKWIIFQNFCQTMLMGWNHLRNVLKCLNTLGRKFQIME